jgi:hypothetical protein
MRNNAAVTGGKTIAVWSHYVSFSRFFRHYSYTNPHWSYGPFFLCVILSRESLCPSSGDINRATMIHKHYSLYLLVIIYYFRKSPFFVPNGFVNFYLRLFKNKEFSEKFLSLKIFMIIFNLSTHTSCLKWNVRISIRDYELFLLNDKCSVRLRNRFVTFECI